MGLMDFRCKNLVFLSTDPADPAYWGERWEEYRLMYLGGRWLAKVGVTFVEIYNEPDKDIDCMNAGKWGEHFRIRSHAVQEAYADHNTAQGGTPIIPEIYAPATAGAWNPSYGPATLAAMNLPFPGNTPRTDWKAANGYSFHRYGDFSTDTQCTVFSETCRPGSGWAVRKGHDSILPYLTNAGLSTMPVGISEFNCFTTATADDVTRAYFLGKHIMDLPSTAACLAGQVAGFSTSSNPPPFISAHKMIQNMGIDKTNTRANIAKIGKYRCSYS